MSDVIGVLNSGSSSIKYSLFAIDGRRSPPNVHGQIEGIYTAPRFVAKVRWQGDRGKTWGEGVKLGHRDATEFLLGFLRNELPA